MKFLMYCSTSFYLQHQLEDNCSDAAIMLMSSLYHIYILYILIFYVIGAGCDV